MHSKEGKTQIYYSCIFSNIEMKLLFSLNTMFYCSYTSNSEPLYILFYDVVLAKNIVFASDNKKHDNGHNLLY